MAYRGKEPRKGAFIVPWGGRMPGFRKARKEPGNIIKIVGKRERMSYGHHAYYEVHGNGTGSWEIMPYGKDKADWDRPSVTTISAKDVRRYLDMYHGRKPTLLPLHGDERGAASNRKLDAVEFLAREDLAAKKKKTGRRVSHIGRGSLAHSRRMDFI